MTHIIAILFLAGHFQVAVEGSSGYLEKQYADTPQGVARFFADVRQHLAGDAGRFYPCLVYEVPVANLLDSALALRIGTGTGYATSLVNGPMVAEYRQKHAPPALTARVAERICEHHFPKDYKTAYPAGAGVLEFYRAGVPPEPPLLRSVARCEALLEHEADKAAHAGARGSRHAHTRDTLAQWLDEKLARPRVEVPEYAEALQSARSIVQGGTLSDETVKAALERCEALTLLPRLGK